MTPTQKLVLKLLFSGMSLAWLLPAGLGWKHRNVSPLWAWIRIVSGAAIFCWFNLCVWRPNIPYVNYLGAAGALVYCFKFFVKRQTPPSDISGMV
jgi:hypothetical protein